ncbi:MAG: ABC transporter permease [Firmicutes bacterium]|nr:ABC transporter permease [Bacillota bacterium]
MTRYFLRRLVMTIPTLLGVSIILFAVMNLAPGGPEAVLMGDDISPDAAARIRANLGLDQPLPVQYGKWLVSMLQGDLGNSFRTGESVTLLIWERLPNTLLLTVAAFAFALVISIPIGVISATKKGSLIDKVASIVAFLGVSFPTFWLGIVAILIFSQWLGWFPVSGIAAYGMEKDFWNRLHHLILPAATLGSVQMATYMRFTRSGMLEVLKQDYIRTARSKGLGEGRVITVHALRNGLITVVTIMGLSLPALVGGSVLTETIFAWPGLGRLAVNAVFQRDYPIIMGVNMVVALITVLANLGVDIMYTLIDPRIAYD